MVHSSCNDSLSFVTEYILNKYSNCDNDKSRSGENYSAIKAESCSQAEVIWKDIKRHFPNINISIFIDFLIIWTKS